MRGVSVIGIGQAHVGERWDTSLRDLALEAIRRAMIDADAAKVDSLVVGNMLSGELASQENLATLLVDYAGLGGIEAVKVEAACASGGAAIRGGTMLVASGAHDVVLVVGVEKMTDRFPDRVAGGLALASDGDFESLQGVTFVALNALIMRAYMQEYGYSKEDFAGFAVNAHKNGATNPHAMFQRPISAKEYFDSGFVATPIQVMDSAPVCDGAAALVLCATELVKERRVRPEVRIVASTGATDTIAVATRRDPLWLDAGFRSARRAYDMAGLEPKDIDLFEAHDAFAIMAALSLEACGFAERGKGALMASEAEIGLGGRIPIQTLGGLKARGHPVGATGVYQAVEACLQLRGEAGPNQVDGARVALTQNIGGSGSCVVTHILTRGD
jgi:acetyl-CoA C-acetyltransferase